jgi:hypothetical protein
VKNTIALIERSRTFALSSWTLPKRRPSREFVSPTEFIELIFV